VKRLLAIQQVSDVKRWGNSEKYNLKRELFASFVEAKVVSQRS
jgi:hypothetical protein